MKKNKGFTTPCYMAVKDGNHANRLLIALKKYRRQKSIWNTREYYISLCLWSIHEHYIIR